MLKSLEILFNKSWELEGYKNILINAKEYELIKQDLKILSIIYKKSVNIGVLKARFYISSTPLQLMNMYNNDCNYIQDNLTINEAIELYQWLKSNKVGDNQ